MNSKFKKFFVQVQVAIHLIYSSMKLKELVKI